MPRTPAIVALAVALAQPALATTVYVPFADRLEAGAPQRRTELRLTNGQPSFGQSVTYRIFVDGKAGAQKTFQLGPGQSRSVAPVVPVGASGLIEIDAPNDVSVGARLLVERPGNKPSVLGMPAFVAESAAAGGAAIVLQGLTNSDGKQSGLSIQNFDTQAATCSLAFENADGKAIGATTELQLPGKSAHTEENLFSALSSAAVTDAIARISCDRRFWSYALVEEIATGDSELVTPALELTPTITTNAVTAASLITFSKSGTYLVSSDQNLNWKFYMPLGTLLTFRKVVVDYDFYVNIWDPKKPKGTHEILWFQKCEKWGTCMMSYVNSRGAAGGMRYKTNYNYSYAATLSPGVVQKTAYHMHYEWDGINKKNFYNIYNKSNGSLRTKGGWTTGAGSYSTSKPFIGMGGQTSCSGCPESKTPGWTFSNLVVQFVP